MDDNSREDLLSDKGQQLQEMLYQHLLKKGIVPKPGYIYIIGGKEKEEGEE